MSRLFSNASWLAWLLLATAATASSARGGVVLTAAGRQEGTLSATPGALRVGGRSIAWNDVLLAVNDPQAESPTSPETVHLVSGEILVGTVKLLAGRMTLSSPLLGHWPLELSQVRAIDFTPELPFTGRERDATLYRRRAGDVPCRLIWIRGERVAIQSAVGASALEKKDLRRYVVQAALEAPAGAESEITLADGSLLRGGIQPVESGFLVKSRLLGEQMVRHASWHSVRRSSAASPCFSLDQLQPAQLRTFPLIRRPADPPRSVRAQPGLAGSFMQRIYVWPRSMVAYRVPGGEEQKYLFAAGLGLADHSRGAARVRILVDDRVAFERLLDPGLGKSIPVSFEAGGGSMLKFEVDFGESVRFPCSVTVDDALLVRK